MPALVPILYEDSHLVAIDKPFGISVVVEDGVRDGRDDAREFTIKDWVKNRYNLPSNCSGAEDEFEQRFGIVHRLDKETSGVLLIARDKGSFDYLKGLFKFRRIHKEYQALVYGIVKEDRFIISAPIQRNKNNGLLYSVDDGGRSSDTEFIVNSRLQIKGNNYSYLYAFPKTGRTHQIRVHLRALGHPVVNDSKYAGRDFLKQSLDLNSRMMLHAKKVIFTDWDGKENIIESKYSLTSYFAE